MNRPTAKDFDQELLDLGVATTPRYDEQAAKLAWSRTIEFFNKHLPQE